MSINEHNVLNPNLNTNKNIKNIKFRKYFKVVKTVKKIISKSKYTLRII